MRFGSSWICKLGHVVNTHNNRPTQSIICRDKFYICSYSQVLDFLPHSALNAFMSFVSNVKAGGGYDACEDVAGGLKVWCALHISSETPSAIERCDLIVVVPAIHCMLCEAHNQL